MTIASFPNIPFQITAHNQLGFKGFTESRVGQFFTSSTFGQGKLRVYANAITGNAVIQDIRQVFVDIEREITWSYIFNSLATPNRWRLAFGRVLKNDTINQRRYIIEEDGSEVDYVLTSDNVYAANFFQTSRPTLSFDSSTNTWSRNDPLERSIEIFTKTGLLQKFVDKYGNVTEYQYTDDTESANLKMIIAPSGRRFEFTYQDSALIVSLTDIDGQSIQLHQYSFDEDQQLVNSQTNDGYRVQYSYPDNQIIVTQQDGTNLTLSLNEDNRINSVTAGSNEVYKFDYQLNKTLFILPNSASASILYEANQLTAFINADLSLQYKFNQNSQVTCITYSDATQENFDYDQEFGFITQHTRQDKSFVKFTYQQIQSQNVLTCRSERSSDESLPSADTYYMYQVTGSNFLALQYRISAQGRITQFGVNPSTGQRIQKWSFLNKQFFNSSGLLFSDAFKKWLEENISTVERSLTTNDYDPIGRIIIQTDYVELDEQGQGIKGDNNPTKKFGYNLRGQVIQTDVYYKSNLYRRDNKTYNDTGDPLTSVVGAESPLSQTTNWSYVNNKIQQTLADGSINEKTVSDSNRMAFSALTTSAGSRVTEYQYSPSSNAVVTMLPGGKSNYQFYDDQQYLCASISPSRILTIVTQNPTNRSVITAVYPKRITQDLCDTLVLKDIVQFAAKGRLPRRSYIFYDLLPGQVKYTVNAKKVLTEYQYNKQNKRVNTIVYKQKITRNELSKLLDNKPITRTPQRTVDQVDSVFYDDDGLVIGRQDRAGYVDEYLLDGGGRRQLCLQYNQPNNKVALYLDLVRPDPELKNCAKIYYFNNLLSQCIYEVSSIRRLTQRNFCLDGNLDYSTIFAKKVELAWYQNTLVPPTVISTSNDLKSQYRYDLLRRPIAIEKSTAEVNTISYDCMDRQTTNATFDRNYPRSAKGDHYRAAQKKFDQWGQVKAETTPFVAQWLRKIDLGKSSSDVKLTKQAQVWDKHSLRYSYDKLTGLKTDAIDPLGGKSYYFYDDNRNLIVTVSPMFLITRSYLNKYDELMCERLYQKRWPDNSFKLLKGGYITPAVLQLLDSISNRREDQITRYRRNFSGEITTKIDPEGNVFEYQYDSFENQTLEKRLNNEKTLLVTVNSLYDTRNKEIQTTTVLSGQAPMVLRREFANRWSKMSKCVNEIGGVTLNKYDPVGNLLKQEQLSDSNHFITMLRNTYDVFNQLVTQINSDRVLSWFSYDTQRRTERVIAGESGNTYTKNIFNEVILLEVTLHKRKVYCEKYNHAPDGQICYSAIGDKQESVVRTFNLLGKTKSQVEADSCVTEFSYNSSQQLTKQVTDAGQKGLKITRQFWRNSVGNPTLELNPRKIYTRNHFDRRNRLVLAVNDAGSNNLNQTTRYSYSIGETGTSCVQGAVNDSLTFTTVNKLDGLGRICSIIIDPDNCNIASQKVYDNCNNITKEIDPNGYIKRHYYDLQQQKRFSVIQIDDKTCAIIYFEYMPGGRMKTCRQYFNTALLSAITDTTALVDLYTIAIQSPLDVLTRYYYNDLKLKEYQANFLYDLDTGSYQVVIAEKNYDGKKRLLLEVNYANPIIVQTVDGLTCSLIEKKIKEIIDPLNDRCTRNWYDRGNLSPILSLNSRRVFTENEYDSSSQIIRRTIYDAPSTVMHAQLPDDVSLINITKNAAQDRTTYWGYDNCKREIFTVDAKKYVTGKKYDENDNVTQTCLFKQTITIPGDYASLVALVRGLVPNPALDSITTYSYYNNDLLKTKTDGLNQPEQYFYDCVKNKNLSIDPMGRSWKVLYDTAKRVTDEFSPVTDIALSYKSGKTLAYTDGDALRRSVCRHTARDKMGNAVTIIDDYGDISQKDKNENKIFENRTVTFSYNSFQAPLSVTQCDVQIDSGASYSPGWLSLDQLPFLAQDMTAGKRYNTQGKLVAWQNNAGLWSFNVRDIWSFNVRDNLGRIIFLVSNQKIIVKYTYNVFSEITQENQFSWQIPDEFDWSKFIDQGLTLFDISDNENRKCTLQIEINDSKDRKTIYERSQTGKVTRKLSPQVFFYSNGLSGRAMPETRMRYNSFEDCVYQGVLVEPDLWSETFTWWDQSSQKSAELDQEKYLSYYESLIFGKLSLKVDWYNAVLIPPDLLATYPNIENIPLETVLPLIQPCSGRDIVYSYDYNQRLLQTEEVCYDQNVDTLQFNNGIPCFTAGQQNIKKLWAYDANGMTISYTLQNEAGESQTNFYYYDERNLKIGETEPSRVVSACDTQDLNVINNSQQITPFKRFKLSALGQTVVTQHSKSGCASPLQGVLPSFLGPILEEINCYDSQRGLLQYAQDARSNVVVYLYTANKTKSRQLSLYSTWTTALEKTSFHVDEEWNTYTVFDQVASTIIRRDGQPVESTYYQYNTFQELTGRGDSPGNELPHFINRDILGREWSSNSTSGANTIRYFNLAGQITLQLQAVDEANVNLVNQTEEDLPALLTADPKYMERLESTLDLSGRVLNRKFPIWFKDPTTLPTRSYISDRKNNLLCEKTSLGHEKWSEYQLNRLLRQTLPEAEVIDEFGVSSRVIYPTSYSYSWQGYPLGETQNNNSKVNIVNQVGQQLATVLADGTWAERNAFDAERNLTTTQDARGFKWIFSTDPNNNVIDILFPSGKHQGYSYDEKNQRDSSTEPDTQTYYYSYDATGYLSARYMPMGDKTTMQYDRNEQPLSIVNPDGSGMSWGRNFFGQEAWQIDLAGRKYDYNYGVNQTRLKSIQGHQTFQRTTIRLASNQYSLTDFGFGPINSSYTLNAYQALNLVPTNEKNIEYSYEYGGLTGINDYSEGRDTFIELDSENRRSQVAIFDISGRLQHKIITGYDEQGRELTTTNSNLEPSGYYTNFWVNRRYDASNNYRLISLDLAAPNYCGTPCPPITQHQEYWFKCDSANRCLVANGGLTATGIQPAAPLLGVGFEYQYNFRSKEKFQANTTSPWPQYSFDLTYAPNGPLETTFYQGLACNLTTTRILHPLDFVSSYSETQTGTLPPPFQDSTNSKSRIVDYNHNRIQVYELYADSNTNPTICKFSPATVPFGFASSEVSTYVDTHFNNTTNNYTFEYLASTSWLPSTSNVTCTYNGNKGPMSTAQFFYNANFDPFAKNYSSDELSWELVNPFVLYDVNSEGHFLGKNYLSRVPKWQQSDAVAVHYIHNTDGQAIAGYSYEAKTTSQFFHCIEHINKKAITVSPSVSEMKLISPLQCLTSMSGYLSVTQPRDPLDFMTPRDPDMSPNYYTVEPGDTAQSIASKVFGDVEAAPLIARTNALYANNQPLRAGMILRMPFYVSFKIPAGSSRNYQDFKNYLIGSLSPRIIPPHLKVHKPSFWQRLIKVIAIAVVLLAAQWAAAYLVGELISLGWVATGSEAASFLSDLATGVIAGIGDAAVQGIAIALNIQSKFSMAEVVQVALSAGIPTGGANIAQKLLNTALAQVSIQLAEMAAHLRNSFDLNSILIQLATQAAAAKIDPEIDDALSGTSKLSQNTKVFMCAFANNTLNNSVSALVGKVIFNTPPDIQQLAADTVGNSLVDSIYTLKKIANTPPENVKPARPLTPKEQQFINDVEKDVQQKLPDPKLDVNQLADQTKKQLTELDRARLQSYNSSTSLAELAAKKSVLTTSQRSEMQQIWQTLSSDVKKIALADLNLRVELFNAFISQGSNLINELKQLNPNPQNIAEAVAKPVTQLSEKYLPELTATYEALSSRQSFFGSLADALHDSHQQDDLQALINCQDAKNMAEQLGEEVASQKEMVDLANQLKYADRAMTAVSLWSSASKIYSEYKNPNGNVAKVVSEEVSTLALSTAADLMIAPAMEGVVDTGGLALPAVVAAYSYINAGIDVVGPKIGDEIYGVYQKI